MRVKLVEIQAWVILRDGNLLPEIATVTAHQDQDLFEPPPGTEVYATRTARQWVDQNNIVRMSCLRGVTHTAQDARDNIAAIPEKQVRPVLVDIRKLKGVSREAREVYRSREANPHLVAVAMVVESPLSRIIGNFFIGLSRVYVPTRLFTSPAEGLEWVSQFCPAAEELNRAAKGQTPPPTDPPPRGP
jgi:hypothetical protein